MMVDVKLYLGDCLEILPTLEAGSVDAVITDPPYGFNHYDSDVSIDSSIFQRFIEISKSLAIFGYPELIIKICVELQIIPDELIVWNPPNKHNGFGKKLPHWNESIAIFGNLPGIDRMTMVRSPDKWGRDSAKRRGSPIEYARLGDIWNDASPGWGFNHHLRNHPNEKPISLMTRLIELCSDRSDTILDPFMGSGTTGVACVQTGRNFIGIEIDPKYFAIAEKRIKEAQLQIRMEI